MIFCLRGCGVGAFVLGMRQPRLKAPANHPVAHYHCLSRVVDRQFVFGPLEREQFVRYMREYEAFCGVRILTYCVLSNHFHLLVEVPKRPEQLPGAEALIEKLEGLSGHTLRAGELRQQVERLRQAGDEAGEQALRERLCALMWDVSAYMKLVKQRFTQWFNRQKGRKGTLWEERFRSVLVESTGAALEAMAGYIDLNPVRAGLVTDPKEYRWCGYGEAVAGGELAREGILAVMGGKRGESVAKNEAKELAKGEVKKALERYRVQLFGMGEAREGTTAEGVMIRKGFTREEVLAEVDRKGRLEMAEYLRLKVRYFADGAVLGTRGYVEEVFRAYRDRFGEKRKSGARRMRGVEAELYTLRELKVRVLG